MLFLTLLIHYESWYSSVLSGRLQVKNRYFWTLLKDFQQWEQLPSCKKYSCSLLLSQFVVFLLTINSVLLSQKFMRLQILIRFNFQSTNYFASFIKVFYIDIYTLLTFNFDIWKIVIPFLKWGPELQGQLES